MSGDGATLIKPARCPICGGPLETLESRPFCSPRCRDVDLGRWLTGSYVIAGGQTDEDDAEGAPPDAPDGEPDGDEPRR
jgi:endogenous inhibitor of DNA gyrase (YacG/DUF329 family)